MLKNIELIDKTNYNSISTDIGVFFNKTFIDIGNVINVIKILLNSIGVGLAFDEVSCLIKGVVQLSHPRRTIEDTQVDLKINYKIRQ